MAQVKVTMYSHVIVKEVDDLREYLIDCVFLNMYMRVELDDVALFEGRGTSGLTSAGYKVCGDWWAAYRMDAYEPPHKFALFGPFLTKEQAQEHLNQHNGHHRYSGPIQAQVGGRRVFIPLENVNKPTLYRIFWM